MQDSTLSFGFGDFDDVSETKSPTPDDSFGYEGKLADSFSSPAAFDDSFTNGKSSRKKKDGSKKKSKKGKDSMAEKESPPASQSRRLLTMQPLTKQKSGRRLSSPSSPQGKRKGMTKVPFPNEFVPSDDGGDGLVKQNSQTGKDGFPDDNMNWFMADPTGGVGNGSSKALGSNGHSQSPTSKTKRMSTVPSSPLAQSRKNQSRRSSMVGRVDLVMDNSSMEMAEVAKAETKQSRRRSFANKDEIKGKSRSKVKSSAAGGDHATGVKQVKQRVPPRELFSILDIEPWSSDNTKYSDEELMDAIEADPESVKKKYRFEFFGVVIYPFSMMCAIGASMDAIQMCYDVFPEALHENDPWVGSPLHYASGYEGPVDVVRWLLEQDSGMTSMLNRLKRSPFHIACQFNPRSSVLEALLEVAPKGLQVTDKYGCTPLHLACENNAPGEVLEMMTENYAMACIASSQAGATPLHLALENRVHLPKIKVLVKTQESVLSIRDVEGRTPLHVAIENECDARIVKFLVKTFPKGLEIRTEWLNETPLEMANRLEAEDDVLAILEA